MKFVVQRETCGSAELSFTSDVSSKIFFFFYSVLRPFSANMRRANQYVGRKRENPEKNKHLALPTIRTWLVSHVARAGLEPTPDTAVR